MPYERVHEGVTWCRQQGGRGLRWWGLASRASPRPMSCKQRYDVTLYESDNRLGGHTDTHDVVTPDARHGSHRHRIHCA